MRRLRRSWDLKRSRIWKTDAFSGKIRKIYKMRKKGRKKKNRNVAGLAELYAHRGYHDKPEIPENSMAAFRRAIEYGLPTEIDVHLIADGSLVVFHDDDLERETGVKGTIEDYDLSNLRKLRLEGTDEVIPTFDEVLDLYEDTGLQLLIELKVVRGNHRALTEAVCRRLDSYKGPFALQSFDPRVLIDVRKFRPGITRGQLAKNFHKASEGLPFYQVALLSNMALNILAKPDFISYKFLDRDNRVLRRSVDKKGTAEASWTIRTPRAFRAALNAGCVPIFEQIEPEDLAALRRDR